jgi:hypothetical protein
MMSALISSLHSRVQPEIRPIAVAGQGSPATLFGSIPISPSSIANYIDAAVAPCVSGHLISPDALSNIRRIAALLPGALTDFFGFECQLGVSEPNADFLVCCRATQGGLKVLNGQIPGQALPAFFENHPVWQRIRSFSTEWSNPQSPLFDCVHNMWLEFDVEGVAPSIPVPSVFIGPENLQSAEPAEDNSLMPGCCAWLTDSALPLLLSGDLDPALRRQIARCVNLLPPGACIFQVGQMLARASRITRLCVRGVSKTQIIEYLQALDYDTSSGQLHELLDLLGPLAARIDLDMDVADRVLPKIGLEAYPAADASAIHRLLNQLVSCGLSTPAKAEGLESWRGMALERLTPEIWPRDLLALSGFLGGRVHSVFARWLHHVKIVYQPGFPLRAKAYLAVQHLWLAPEQIKDLAKQAQPRVPEQEG